MDLKKYIKLKKEENKKIINKETKSSKMDLIDFIKKEKIVLYGKSALEVDLGDELTLPIYCIFKKSDDLYKTFFTKLNRKYKYAYKIQPLLHKNTIIYNFRLIRYLVLYKININDFVIKNKLIINKKDFSYINPIISLIDIYYIYSTPLYNNIIYEDILKIEQKYLNNNEIKIINNNNNNNKLDKKNIKDNEEFHKKCNKFILDNYITDNKHILISGIIALNSILGTDYSDSVDLIVSKIRLNSEIEKLKKVLGNIVIKQEKTLVYFLEINHIYLNGIKLLTLYVTEVPFSYYKKYLRCNYHTVLFILIHKMITNKNMKYLKYINLLLSKGIKKNILKNNKFQCFQSEYIKDSVKDFVLYKNKITI